LTVFATAMSGVDKDGRTAGQTMPAARPSSGASWIWLILSPPAESPDVLQVRSARPPGND